MAESNLLSWRTLYEQPGEWCFQCSKTLRDLNFTGQAADHFYELIRYIETDRKLIDFRLIIRHPQQNNKLQVLVKFCGSRRNFAASSDDICMACNPQHQLFSKSRFSTQKHTLAWLDAEGRPELIILTPQRHVERLSDLNHKVGEMAAFWQDAMNILDKAGEIGMIRDMAINQGTYRKNAHLHLKIYITKESWRKIEQQYAKQIEEMRRIRAEQSANPNELDISSDNNGCIGKQGHHGTVCHSLEETAGLTKSSKFV